MTKQDFLEFKGKVTELLPNAMFRVKLENNHEVNGIVYEVDNNIVGLAHYRRMPSPLRGQDIGFLDDLFVDSKFRGKKIGEKLINKMKEISKSKSWNLVRWITRDDNVRAKSLYDRVSEKTNWDVYELK